MLALLLLCVVIATIVLYFVLCQRTKQSRGDDAPIYSKSLPFIGITHLALCNKIKLWDNLKNIAEESSKRGGVIKAKVGLDTVYGITDPDDGAIVANACLEKIYLYRFLKCIFGDALLTAPAPIWKRHRKLLNPAYSLPVIHGFIDVFNDQAKLLVDDMQQFAGKGPTKVTSLVEKSVIRSTCITVFGSRNLPDDKTFSKYINGIRDLSHVFIDRARTFWQHNDTIYNISGLLKKQDEIVNTVTNISNDIIQKVQNESENKQNANNFDGNQAGYQTLLDKYLEINADNDLSKTELREELDLAIAAAYDTTATQLEIILILLGSYPNVQKRVYNEIIDVIGLEKEVKKEDLRKLVYTDAVIKESLRFHPVVPMVGRYIDRDVKLKNCTLRGGAHAIIALHTINRDSSWGLDADQFRPERWLEPGGIPNGTNTFATFSIGKRSCIGKTYALTSLKITIAHVIRKYRIEADYNKIQFKYDLLLVPVKGNEITLWCNESS